MTAAKASARKSKGEYKPLIVYPNGSTEVVEKSPDRHDRNTKNGVVAGNRYARGTTYATREEAIEAAQRLIDARREEALARAEKFAPLGERAVSRVMEEARLWGAS